MDTVNPLSSISPIGSTTSQSRGRGQEQQTPSQGQLLKALVLETKGSNRFILDIGGSRVPVSSEAVLSPGQSLRLQVVKTSPQVELKIVTDILNQLTGRSLTLLGNNLDLSTLFRGLQQQSPPLIESLTPTSRNIVENFFSLQQNNLEGASGGATLKQLVDSLGLNLEQLLARGDKNSAVQTLKAALLEIAHIFKSGESLADTTGKILTTLELFQFAQLQTGSDSHFIFPLPLPFIEQGYLVVERDGADGSQAAGNTENRFSLHMTMVELGNLRIDFLHNAEGLFIRFHADGQEKADFIESFSNNLKDAISDVPLINLSFSGDAPDPIGELVRQLVPEGRSMLNTKV